MKYDKYLPIGTVVLLKDALKKVMITGFYVKSTEDDKVFDYAGCIYPEGVISSDQNLMFNHDDISDVYYMGYITDEQRTYNEKIIDIIKKIESGEVKLPEE